jgi:hypothetical protein
MDGGIRSQRSEVREQEAVGRKQKAEQSAKQRVEFDIAKAVVGSHNPH